MHLDTPSAHLLRPQHRLDACCATRYASTINLGAYDQGTNTHSGIMSIYYGGEHIRVGSAKKKPLFSTPSNLRVAVPSVDRPGLTTQRSRAAALWLVPFSALNTHALL